MRPASFSIICQFLHKCAAEKMDTIKTKVCPWVRSLAEEVRKSSDTLYCIVFGIYLLSLLLPMMGWSVPGFTGRNVRYTLTVFLFLFLGVYIGSVFVMWLRKKWTIIPVLAAVALFLYLCAGMQRNIFDGLMIVILVLFSYGRQFKHILKTSLLCTAATLITAALGLLFGYTAEMAKTGSYGAGFALGMSHPNVWGTYALFILLMVWYLFIRQRSGTIRFCYYALSWGLGVFMIFVPKCRTEALLAFALPVTAVICRALTGWRETGPGRQENAGSGRKVSKLRKAILWILILTPVICFLLTVILSAMRGWLVENTFGTYIENFSKRFIQSGLAFKEHGFPLLGETIRFKSGFSETLGGYKFVLYVMDNAYSSFAILRGMIWMVPILIWLTFANWKAAWKKDYVLLAISILFCLLGLMERFALDAYNFVYFYPLAIAAGRVFSKPPPEEPAKNTSDALDD